MFELFQILAHGAQVAPRRRLGGPGSKSQARMVGGKKCQHRRGQRRWKTGKRVGPERRRGAPWNCSPRVNQSAMGRKAGRRQEQAGEESRLRNQRLRVEGSGTRFGSLSGGAALSSDLRSRKYRRSAWLRATRL